MDALKFETQPMSGQLLLTPHRPLGGLFRHVPTDVRVADLSAEARQEAEGSNT